LSKIDNAVLNFDRLIMKPHHGPPYFLDRHSSREFPDVSLALTEPDGLLAIGGDLSMPRILAAYQRGIFPWYSDGQPILWWSPNPRAVLIPDEINISRSLRKTLRRGQFQATFDTCFEKIIGACAAARKDGRGTWITQEMQSAYIGLHTAGYAHSVEIWQDEILVGGLYGISLGRLFFGESMFSRVNDASKVALVFLAAQLQRWGFALIDCQVQSPHLASLGAQAIPRHQFVEQLTKQADQPTRLGTWQFDADLAHHIQTT